MNAPALTLLDQELTWESREEWTQQVARPVTDTHRVTESVLIFRLGAEWLAVGTETVERVAPHTVMHSLPSHRSDAQLGVVNIEGDLLVCVPFAPMIGARRDHGESGSQTSRTVVLKNRLAIGVDEVQGVVRYDVASLTALPVTLADAAQRFSLGLFVLEGRCVARLDDELVLRAAAMALA